NNYVWGLWEDYQRFYPNIEFNYVYYYDVPKNDSAVYHYFPGKKMEEIVAIQADMLGVRKSLFITPAEFRQRIRLKDDDLSLIMELEYKGKKELLRMNGDNPPWPKQATVAGTLKRLLRDKDIRVAFLSGHYERKPHGRFERDFYRHLNDKGGGFSAINMGFDSDTVSVLHNDVPDDVDVLVIASPLSPLKDIETERIKKYIDKGGNAVFFTEPDKKFILDPVLKNIGVTVEDGTVVFENPHEMPHIIPSQFTQAGIMMAREKLSEESIRDKVNLTRMDLIGASNILFDSSRGFSMEPLTFSPVNNTLWVKKGVLVVDSAAPVYSSQEGDYMRENYVMAAKLSRRINNKEQRIVVATDGDFMNNLRFYSGSQGLAFYSWVLYNEYPVYVNELKDVDNLFSVNFQTTTIVRYSLLYVLPGLMLIGAIVLLVRRNRK
ncbi:MAG TPA: Gldg family protein, partial [Pseudobacter sp.]|nr:Gldg family protein [Pseudobacter sp.]